MAAEKDNALLTSAPASAGAVAAVGATGPAVGPVVRPGLVLPVLGQPRRGPGTGSGRTAIDVQEVTRSYGSVHALREVSLAVEQGEWVAIMGPSGSGKTTLVNLIGCLDRATQGAILIDGTDVGRLSGTELTRFRAEKVGFVFQQFHLVPYLTALENVMLAQHFHSLADEGEARQALERVGLGHRVGHLPGQLSGGEQQRVSIARALINDPSIILADEPTGNLDEANEEIVMELLHSAHDAGKTIVMVTHDPSIARLADRRIDLHHGRISDISIYCCFDDEQIDEVLEQLWTIRENGDPLLVDMLRCPGPLPLSRALRGMARANLIAYRAEEGRVEFRPTGEQRARDIIRRHRLAEVLFTNTFELRSEAEMEQQACKFEHILSPEATVRICTFLNHPVACPHGSPIPPGDCCPPRRG